MSRSLENKRILNVSEAARYSDYSRGWIESWLRDGLLPYESPPSQGEGKQRRKYIRRADLDAFLDSHYQRTGQHKQGAQGNIQNRTPGMVTLLPKKAIASGRSRP